MTADGYLDGAVEVARAAGALLVDRFERGVVAYRKDDFDVVTDADIASEKLMVDELHSRFPDHAVLAEESGRNEVRSEYCWLVDPLDGTKNFARHNPCFSVTLALECKGEVVVGVVFDPIRDEMFSARRGAGARRNGVQMSVSETIDLSDALVATGFPSAKRHQSIDPQFFYQVSMRSQGVRRSGSTALDLAYVACGRLDAFWEYRLPPWDLAAGTLLVVEAGGCCSNLLGDPHPSDQEHVLADNGLLHGQFTGLFSDILQHRYHVAAPG